MMPGYLLLSAALLFWLVTNGLQIWAALKNRRAQAPDPMVLELAELKMKVTALEEKALELQPPKRMTAGDLNGLPNTR
jgi:hypothetical protein